MNWIEAIGKSTTPYMLFLEHDWAFKRPVKIATFLDVFDKYDFVNHVRFNMRNNVLAMWDHLIEPEDRIPELPRPGPARGPASPRVSKWRDDWLATIAPLRDPAPGGSRTALLGSTGTSSPRVRGGPTPMGQVPLRRGEARPFVHHTNGS